MAKLGILQEIKENIDVYIHGLWILKSKALNIANRERSVFGAKAVGRSPIMGGRSYWSRSCRGWRRLSQSGTIIGILLVLGTIKVLRPWGSGKYLSCILCKSFKIFSVPCLVCLVTVINQTSILSKISAGASLHAPYYVFTSQKSLLSCVKYQPSD